MSNAEVFDARTIAPQQGGGAHPPGMFPATITNTYAAPTQSGKGGKFMVEFTTEVGSIKSTYNLWNENPTAKKIADGELSALCHAVGRYTVTFPKDQNGNPIMQMAGAELRGATCRIEVTPQLQRDGTPSGYMEINKVFDLAGNEPGKPAMAGQQPNPGFQQPQQGFQQPQQPQQPMQQQPQGGWSQQPPPNAANPAPQPPQNNSGWTQQPNPNANTGAAPNAPPWAKN